tara:strand:+ start:123 stop:356 length:234 start_codon:yes stop_codon:yes gene_type:complete
MTSEERYKKALTDFLFSQALGMNKSELQDVLFFEEQTTKNWTLEQCRFQYVKDQLEFIDGGNMDKDIEETWNIIFKT